MSVECQSVARTADFRRVARTLHVALALGRGLRRG